VQENASHVISLPLFKLNLPERSLFEPQIKQLTEKSFALENRERRIKATKLVEDGHIILFLIYTGARKREALDAKWQDIDWDKKSWRIPKTKSGKVRHIPLSKGALSVLEALENLCLEGRLGRHLKASCLADMSYRYIFPNIRTGQPYVSFFYSWNAARVRAGMPDLRVHDLRHSFASFLVNAGRSLYEVQELLGHADIRTTSRYAHLSRERLIAAVEVVPFVEVEVRGLAAELG
jgi:integrase